MKQWKEISLHEIKGIRVGHAQDEEHGSGCDWRCDAVAGRKIWIPIGTTVSA